MFEYGFRIDGQTKLHTFNPAPRLGLTVDPTGKGNSRLYANWGFYWEFIPGTTYTIGQQVTRTETHTLTGLPAYTKPRPADGCVVTGTAPQQFCGNANILETDPNSPFLARSFYLGTDVISNSAVSTRAQFDRSPLVNSWQVGYERRLPGDIKFGAMYAGNRQHRRSTTTALTNNNFTNNDGRTNYKALEINARRTFKHGLEVSGNYTRSRTYSDTTSTLNSLQLPFRFGIGDWDEPHTGSALLLYEIKGFRLNPVFQFNSGRSYSINSTNALGLPTTVTYVDKEGKPAGRNIYRIPDRWTLNFTVTRPLGGERVKISPTFQILNLTNRVNIQSVSSTFATAGQPTNVSDSRQMQFGATFHF